MMLKELRIKAGMTQLEFADYFGIPYKTVANWEQGVNRCPSYVETLIAEKMYKLIEEREKYSMDSKKFRELQEIKTKEELPDGAAYYSEEYQRHGNSHMEWKNLYNANFELIGQVTVKYSNAIEDLQRIVPESNKNDMALMAYDLVDLGNGFYSVNGNEDTLSALELISKSISQ